LRINSVKQFPIVLDGMDSRKRWSQSLFLKIVWKIGVGATARRAEEYPPHPDRPAGRSPAVPETSGVHGPREVFITIVD